MGLEKRRPGCLPFALRRRFDAVFLEDVAHGLIGDLVTQVGQGALDPVVSPGHILPRKAKNKIDDLLPYTWPSYGFATFAVVPFLGNQRSMPAENRIGREQRADLFESLATENLALDCQSTSLVVVEQDAFRAVRFPEHPVLGAKVLDRFLLLSVDPACDDGYVELPGLENETHGWPDAGDEA